MRRRPTSRIFLLCAALLAACGREEPRPPSGQAPVPLLAGGTDSRAVIVAFGDSLTAGPGVDPEFRYPELLQSALDARGYSYRVVNAGVSGDTTSSGLTRLRTVVALKPTIVILELGANDGLRGLPLAASRANLEEIIVRLKEAGIQVVLAGMRIPPNYGPLYTRQFEQMYRDLARRHDLTLVPFLLEGVAARPELNLEDGIHPNETGYGIVARTVLETLEPLLSPSPSGP
ncbi:MAG: arylesterase [Acidobacteria bacterium]|nr:arylesterase [Acidobacteriota bacterium]